MSASFVLLPVAFNNGNVDFDSASMSACLVGIADVAAVVLVVFAVAVVDVVVVVVVAAAVGCAVAS